LHMRIVYCMVSSDSLIPQLHQGRPFFRLCHQVSFLRSSQFLINAPLSY
jgi:hypothetical protein